MIETERLRLRAFKPGDLSAFAEINADARVMRHFPGSLSARQTEAMVAEWAGKWARYGFAFSAVERLSDGVFLGMAGLSWLEDSAPFAPCAEIGWRLHPEVWGQGYASEAARGWLAYGFDVVGLSEVYAYGAVTNGASQKVMQRIGMQRRADLDFEHPKIAPDSALNPMVVYRIEAP